MLNNGQQKILNEAVNWFYNSSDQLFEIAGPAGSGKTYLIFEILKALKLKEYEIMPMAYTGQASIVMRSRGFTTARSIHSSLYEVVDKVVDNDITSAKFGIPAKKKCFVLRQYIDPKIRLFFIDEAYMVPEYMVKDILSFGIKIIVCGDSNQLPPVGDNPGFLTGYKVHRLTELMRQAQYSPIVYLANRAIQGLPIHCGIYGDQALVINDDEFDQSMIPYADCICCGLNKTRESLNDYIRNLAGFKSLTPNVGERIICRNNNWDFVQDGIALTNGLTGTVVSMPNVSSYNGSTFKVDFLPDLANSVFFDINVNYEYLVSSYDKRQDLKEYSNRRYMQGEMFEYAYALTTHLCQGSEYNNMIYIEEFMRPQIQNNLNYTGITRAKNSIIIIKKKGKFFYFPNSNKIFNQ